MGMMVLLGIVLLVPPVARIHGLSFWVVARESLWSTWGDWPAAWCSLKIIFLSGVLFCVVRIADELMMIFRRDYLSANLFLVLMAAPSIVFLLGTFYLLKALL
jgi:hypothetical protein